MLIALGIVILVLFPILKGIMPQVTFFALVSAGMDPSLVFGSLFVVALILKLGDEKKAMSFVPWNTMIMISGAVMLLSAATKAGAIDVMASLLTSGLSPLVIRFVLPAISGIMSIFSSFSVVATMVFPLAPAISASTGISQVALISAMAICGHLAGVAPFSTGGAMVLSGEKDEDKKNKLFISLLTLAIVATVFGALLLVVGIVR